VVGFEWNEQLSYSVACKGGDSWSLCSQRNPKGDAEGQESGTPSYFLEVHEVKGRMSLAKVIMSRALDDSCKG
jgi:hypothetical protein